MDEINFAVCDDEEIILDAVYSRVFTIFKRRGMAAFGLKFLSSRQMRDYFLQADEASKPDIVFLDIDMPELNGIELGAMIKENSPKTEIIFVSNRYERVFETFNIHPFGFVRKNNFSTDISNTLKAYIDGHVNAANYFVIQQENKSVTRKLPINEIVYVKSMRSHQIICMVGGEEIDVKMTMDELEKGLIEHGILRTHKSFLVNLKYITRIESTGIELTTGAKIDVSRRKVGEIKAALMKYLRKILSGAVRVMTFIIFQVQIRKLPVKAREPLFGKRRS